MTYFLTSEAFWILGRIILTPYPLHSTQLQQQHYVGYPRFYCSLQICPQIHCITAAVVSVIYRKILLCADILSGASWGLYLSR